MVSPTVTPRAQGPTARISTVDHLASHISATLSRKTKRFALILMAAALIVPVFADEAIGGQGPSVSKTENFRSDFENRAKDNPCTGETFFYDGKELIQMQSGPTHTRFSSHEQGVGFTVAGVRYQTQSWSESSEHGTTPALFTKFTIRQHMIRTDPAQASGEPGDDFFSTLTMKCNAGGCRPEPPAEPAPCR